MSADRTLEAASNVVLSDLANNGGGTYERGTLLPFTPKVGYAVGIGGLHLPANIVTSRTVQWASKAAASEFNANYVGTWLKDGTVYFDAVRYFGPERRSDALLAGVAAGQEAIYDFAAGESIYLDEVSA